MNRNVRYYLHALVRLPFLGLVLTVLATGAIGAIGAALVGQYLVDGDAAAVAGIAATAVARTIPQTLLAAGGAMPEAVSRTLGAVAQGVGARGAILFDPSGRVVWSDGAAPMGGLLSGHYRFRDALAGHVHAELLPAGAYMHAWLTDAPARIAEMYSPVRDRPGGSVDAVFELYRDGAELAASITRARRWVWGLVTTVGLVTYGGLLSLARREARIEAASRRSLSAYARTLEERVAERTAELSQRARTLGTLHAVASTISQALDVRPVAERALEQLLATGDFAVAWIRLRAGAGPRSLLVARGAVEGIEQHVGGDEETGAAVEVARDGRSLLIDEPTGESGAFRSIALVPMPVPERPTGVLGVVARSGRRFGAEDLQLLGSVARQIGVGIGNAELYSEARQREAEARRLSELTHRLGQHADPEARMTEIIDGAVQLTHASHGGVAFPDGDDIVMRRFGGTGAGPEIVRRPIGESVAGHAYISGRPYVITNAARDPRIGEPLARALGLHDGIFAPLMVAGRVTGVLFTCNRENGAFTDHDVVLLTTYADHVAAAVENARLHAQALQREREVSILYRMTTRLPEPRDLEALLGVIVGGAIEIAGAEGGAIGRLTGEEIALRPLLGFPGLDELRLPIGGNAVGLTYQAGEPIIVNALERSPCTPALRARMAALGVRNFLCVPLRVGGATVGVIKVCNKREGEFTEDDLRLVTTFASHAALAIDNTSLFQEIKSTKEYLEHLIASTVDGIVTVDARGAVTFVSQGGLAMLGHSDAALAGRHVLRWWID